MNLSNYRIKSIYTTQTYGGWLEGRPSKESVVKTFRAALAKMWGERPTFVKPMDDGRNGALPQWMHAAWVDGPETNDDAHGSHLVIVWFSDKQPSAEEALDGVDWKKHAEDFWY